jgi:peptidoglycan/xylan/chitin deacetylase (PgdA/CDA1 family)
MSRPWWLRSIRGYVEGARAGGSKREGVRVLSYHGVVHHKKDELLERNFHLVSTFRQQLRVLKRFRVLDLDGLLDHVEGRRPIANGVVITFDDGYENNLVAAEILEGMGMPWCVALTTSLLGSRRTVWTNELALLLIHGKADEIEILDQRWTLADRRSREEAFLTVRDPIKSMPAPSRRSAMEDLERQFPPGECERLLDMFPSFRLMSWDQAKELALAGHVGSHGVHHEHHHANQVADVRLSEMILSREEIERRTGRRPRFFTFPDGAFVGDSAGEIDTAGYDLGFTMAEGTVVPTSDRRILPRLEAVGSMRSFTRDLHWNNVGEKPSIVRKPAS